MSELTAKDIMTQNVIRVHADWALSELAATFNEYMITGAPVIDHGRKLVGVVSTTDLARQRNSGAVRETVPHDFYVRGWEQLGDDGRGFSIAEDSELRVRDIMTPMIFSVPLEATLAEMADIMVGGRVHRLIVTDGDEVVGIVTTLDMLETLRERQNDAPGKGAGTKRPNPRAG